MWSTEYSTETAAAPQAIWRLWFDVAGWPSWNTDLEQANLAGPFAPGSTITMTPREGDPIELRIAEARMPETFVDEAHFGGLVIRTIHRVEWISEDRSRVTYRMEITGAEAESVGPQLGPEISADFPEVLAALVAHAEG